MFKPVQSLQRGLTLIDAISRRKEGAYLKELAAEIGCSAPATYHLVQTLADSGYVRRLERPVRYVLGAKLLQLTENQQQDHFYTVVYEHMRHLCEALPGSSIYLSEYLGQSIVVHAHIASPPEHGHPSARHERMRRNLQRNLHHVLPPYTSAGSVVHLAYWPQEIRDQYETLYPFASYGQAFWGDAGALDAALEQLRKDGCLLVPEPEPTRLKLALPVLRPGGGLAAAITVQWNLPRRQGLAAKKKQLITTALATGQRITADLTTTTGAPA